MVRIGKKAEDVVLLVKKLYGNSDDLNTRIMKVGKISVGIMFMESSSSTSTISDFIVKSIDNISKGNVFDNIKNGVYNCQVNVINDFTQFSYYLSAGFTIIVVDGHDEAIVMETRASLDRGVSESSSEPILRGPKDSFTESHSKNLGLIRKRIKDNNLWFSEVKVGRRTKTRVSIAYLSDVADRNVVKGIEDKLKKIDVDGILDSGDLRSYLVTQKTSFPQLLSTERPDLVCQSILNGKIVILTENSPIALVLPCVFTDFIHTSEDQYQKPFNISLTRILKVIALIITLFTPAVYIAITTFDQTVVPDKLLISLAVQREGVPFPTAFEIILLMTIFEILRESDIRLPTNMGASMSIVGALVLGQAAVDAGIVSPIAVIIIAITSICSLLFTDADFINGIRSWRFLFILSATFLGLIGLCICILCFILKMASLNSFNTSYLSPFAPFSIYDQKDTIVRLPLSKLFRRPSYVGGKNPIKQGGEE